MNMMFPFAITPSFQKEHIKLLEEWVGIYGIRYGCRYGLNKEWEELFENIFDVVRKNAWKEIRDSSVIWGIVHMSVVTAVHDYMRKKSQPLVRLWESGLIPSFDGTLWRLHGNNGIVFHKESIVLK
jgi:hypothetical protein